MRMKVASTLSGLSVIVLLMINSCTKTVTNTKTVIVTDTVNTTIIDSNIHLDKGLVAYYPFNGNTNDSGVNKLNGTIVGGVSFSNDVAGNTNSAVTFDGTTGYIIVPDSTGKLQLDSITISFFAKVADISSPQDFVASLNFNDGTGLSYAASLNGALGLGPQRFQFGTISNTAGCGYPTSDPANGVFGANVIVTNQWYHITCIFSKGLQQIFVNGVLNTAETREFATLNKCSANSLTIGGFWKDGLQLLNGTMDELRIYNRALNQNEITKLAGPLN